MNTHLSEYIKENTKFHNHWFILDYPSNDSLQKIRNSMASYSLEKRNEQLDIVQIDDFVVYTDFNYFRESKDEACLQHRTIINKDMIKKLSKWTSDVLTIKKKNK